MKFPIRPVVFPGAVVAAGLFWLLPAAIAQDSEPPRPRITLPDGSVRPLAPVPGPDTSPAEPAPVITWQSDSRRLTEDTEVKLDFPSEMMDRWTEDPVPLEDGRPGVPLTVTPPLRGTWTWHSAKSGVFRPSEEPQRDQEYTFAVRPDQQDAAGRELSPAQPTFTLKSPGLFLVGHHPYSLPPDDPSRTPTLFLQFNDAVSPPAGDTGARFINDSGLTVRASVRLATLGDLPGPDDIDHSFRHRALGLAGLAEGAVSPPLTRPLPGTLRIEPVSPLPIGKGWRLEVAPVVSADGRSRLDETLILPVGEITPLGIGEAGITHRVGAPKSIDLAFNHPLPADLTLEQVLRRVAVSPEPPGYRVSVVRNSLRITGEFSHDREYRVELTPGLTSEDGRPMTQPYEGTFRFKPLRPEVALPAFSANQLTSGRGVFDVHSVNLRSLRVRIKAADRDSLIYALRAYRHYQSPDRETTENWDDESRSSGLARLPFDTMPGRKIYEQEFASTARLDDQDEFVIDWRRALNGRPVGGLFVSVEGEARPEWDGRKRHFGAQAFVQLTDIGLAWKLSATEAMVFAFSQSTGRPLAGVTVTACDPEKNEVGRTVTAEDGTGRLSRTRARWLLAEAGDDLHAVTIDGEGAEGLGMWRFGVPYDWQPPVAARREVMVFTERPVYLPGHTVFFKAFSRRVGAAGVTLPADPELAVLRVFDPRGRLFHQRDIRFSAAGSLDGSIDLPAGPLGQYRLQIALPPLTAPATPADTAPAEEQESDAPQSHPEFFDTAFLVEEYRPNTFQITFAPDSFRQEGEKASLALQARYLLGKPLAKAEMAWSAGVEDTPFQAAAFPDFRFLDSRNRWYWSDEGYGEAPDFGGEYEPEDRETMITTQAKTDLTDEGRAILEFTVPALTGAPRPRTLVVEAEVTDLNQQTITETWRRTLPSSAFYLGIRTSESMAAAGEPVDIALAAARPDGEPWPQPVESRITVEKIDFSSVRVQSVGGGSNLKTTADRTVVAEAALTVLPKGQASAPFPWTAREPGFYHITARASDPEGRPVESVTSFQVFGSGWAPWQQNDGMRIDLEADRTTYLEGETARILVKSPVTGRALVTLERESVLRHFFVDLTGNSQVIEVPLDASMAPNVFVSVFVVRGADASTRRIRSPEYKVGFTELRVGRTGTRLQVAVTPGQPAYRPGDQGSAQVVVTDGRGAPVAGAEVTLWAADDGVLTLLPYTPPDPWSRFHRPRPLAVVTGSSLMDLLAENPQELVFSNKGYMIGGGDEDMAGTADRLRRNFQPLAFFQGTLTTDADGRAATAFVVPDNLTRFRLVAVAAAGPEAFGTGEGSFEINKPLMLEPSLPRFANVGDSVTVKAIVLNQTDLAIDTEVSLTLDTLATSTGPLVRKVSLAPRGTQAVSFPLSFVEAGSAAWQWKAVSLTPGITLSDTVSSSLSVGFAQPVLRERVFSSSVLNGESANLLAGAKPELLSGQGKVTVTVSNSILNEASGAISHLLHYPYGCVEQTTSSTLPWIALHSFGSTIPGIQKSPEAMRRAIQQGADRLLSMQTSRGGLGYWPGAQQPELWATTYGGMGLVLARDAGAQVPATRLNELAAYLSAELRHTAQKTDSPQLYDRAFACYTLALLGKPEPAYHTLLAGKLDQLPPAARGLLALAIAAAGGHEEDARKVLEAPVDPQSESWQGNLFDSRLTAVSLLAWIKSDPAHAMTATLTDRLLQERTVLGDWGSTYENGWALLALAAHHQATGRPLTDRHFELVFADQTVPITLSGEAATASVTLPFNDQASARRLTLKGQGLEPVRVCIEIEARPLQVPVAPRHLGLGITRTYAKVAPDGSTGPADSLEVGDLVAVTLDLEIPGPFRYLAVDDPLPSLFEAINPRFTGPSRPAAAKRPSEAPRTLPFFFNHQELRHDRALFFADNVWRGGRYSLTYLARVIAQGTVTAPPAKIEVMYEPDRYGLSGSQQISAKAGPPAVAGTSR